MFLWLLYWPDRILELALIAKLLFVLGGLWKNLLKYVLIDRRIFAGEGWMLQLQSFGWQFVYR